MFSIAGITMKGIIRDRVFQGIMAVALILLVVPAASSLSMRQVTELSVTLALSVTSFVLLLLSVLLGVTTLWRDFDRRYAYSVFSLQLNRSTYILGRFLGTSAFIVLSTFALCLISVVVIMVSSSFFPPDRPVAWMLIVLAFIFMAVKYILLVGVATVLSVFSTSLFLPVLGTVCVYLAGTFTQQVYEYVNSPMASKVISPVSKQIVSIVYYVIPNFAGFDLKVNAIYGVYPVSGGLLLCVVYFFAYTSMLLGLAAYVVEKREIV